MVQLQRELLGEARGDKERSDRRVGGTRRVGASCRARELNFDEIVRMQITHAVAAQLFERECALMA
jgi:hypothetical protein